MVRMLALYATVLEFLIFNCRLSLNSVYVLCGGQSDWNIILTLHVNIFVSLLDSARRANEWNTETEVSRSSVRRTHFLGNRFTDRHQNLQKACSPHFDAVCDQNFAQQTASPKYKDTPDQADCQGPWASWLYLDGYEDADKKIKLVKVDLPGPIHIKRVEHSVDLRPAQVSGMTHEGVKLQICNKRIETNTLCANTGHLQYVAHKTTMMSNCAPAATLCTYKNTNCTIQRIAHTKSWCKTSSATRCHTQRTWCKTTPAIIKNMMQNYTCNKDHDVKVHLQQRSWCKSTSAIKIMM